MIFHASKFKYFFFLVLIISIVSGCGKKNPTLPLLSTNSVILAFGDSLTYGYNVPKTKSYPAFLEVLAGLKVVNAGVSGEISEQGLKRFPKTLDKHNPQLVILCHGGNDMLRKLDVKKMELNLREMIQLSLSREIPVILLGVPKPGLFLSVADIYEEIASSMNVIFIKDLIPEVLGNKSLKSDSIHPNEKGYSIMAEEIYSLLLDTGAIQ
ncbi:MAG: arylesterase [Legionellales bacterium]|nr:arylesterase [Legionellales bacterium]|tara:strand:+ start:448 stop:1077 length:630 start_codon:yes stop_codon:yes gene_type:complete